MRSFRPFSLVISSFIIFAFLILTGCGGGGSSSTTSGGGQSETPQNPVPTMSSMNPSSATAGAAALTVTVDGTNFVSTSTVTWNGNALSTVYLSSTTLTAQVPASDLQTAGTASVAVVNPAPGGGTSSAATFTINPVAPGVGTMIPVIANDLAWDPVNKSIYLSLPSIVGSNGNGVQVLNPATGVLGANVFAGSEPNLLSVSANSKYLYVSLNGASNVQRFTLPSLQPDIRIALGSDSFYGPFYAMDLQAAPNADGAVAVVRSSPNVSPSEEGGVVIYDDGVARPQVLCGWIQSGCYGGANLYDSIQWNQDGSVMYAANNEDTGFDFYTIPVTATGFGTVKDYGGLVPGFGAQIHFDPVTKYVYDEDGGVIDPASGSIVGTFAASGLLAVDGALNRAFFLGQTQSNLGSTKYTIESFDMQRFTPVATVTISNVVGYPTHLIRWGTNGLAFTTVSNGSSTVSGGVYIISGSFVNGSGANLSASPVENVHRTLKVQPAYGQGSPKQSAGR